MDARALREQLAEVPGDYAVVVERPVPVRDVDDDHLELDVELSEADELREVTVPGAGGQAIPAVLLR